MAILQVSKKREKKAKRESSSKFTLINTGLIIMRQSVGMVLMELEARSKQ